MSSTESSRECLRDLLTRHRSELISRATEWVVGRSADLSEARRAETVRLVTLLTEAYEALLLEGEHTRLGEFVDYVTGYRAASELRISTVLRGLLSFRYAVEEVLVREVPEGMLRAEVLHRVDEVSFDAVLAGADSYSAKLLATIQTRRRELEEELQELARAKEQEIAQQLRIIEQQRAMMSELSLPILPVWRGVLVMPIIGAVSAARADEALERMLQRLSEEGAKVILLDITGVLDMDVDVASSIVRMTEATRLMGAQAYLVGVTPALAQTMASLDSGALALQAYATLHAGLAAALEVVGFKVVAAHR